MTPFRQHSEHITTKSYSYQHGKFLTHYRPYYDETLNAHDPHAMRDARFTPRLVERVAERCTLIARGLTRRRDRIVAIGRAAGHGAARNASRGRVGRQTKRGEVRTSRESFGTLSSTGFPKWAAAAPSISMSSTWAVVNFVPLGMSQRS